MLAGISYLTAVYLPTCVGNPKLTKNVAEHAKINKTEVANWPYLTPRYKNSKDFGIYI